MQSKSDFWLTLHKLANDLLREGDDNNERAQSVCNVLHALSPGTRGVYLEDLEATVSALSEIAIMCRSQQSGPSSSPPPTA